DSQTRAVALQTQLSSFDNLQVEVQQLDPSSYGVTLYQGNFDMAVYGIGGGHAEPVIGSFRTTHRMPIASMGSPEIDALVAESRATDDEATRKAIYDELQAKLIDRYKMIWM